MKVWFAVGLSGLALALSPVLVSAVPVTTGHTSTLGPNVSEQAERAVREFLAEHPSLQGREYTLKLADKNAKIARCAEALELHQVGRGRAWGTVYLSLRCGVASPPWSRPLTVYVAVNGRYLIAARTLLPGALLDASDWRWVEGDLSRWPPDQVLEQLEQLAGMQVLRPVQAGQRLKLNDLRPMSVVKVGDQVRLTLVGRGFTVTSSAQALGEAAVGGTVRVRSVEGKILQGIVVSAGSVEVALD